MSFFYKVIFINIIFKKLSEAILKPLLYDQVASPATVSRCGMIYMEPVSLGWAPILASWINTLPELLSDHIRFHIKDMFMRFCPALLTLIRRSGAKVGSKIYF